MSRNKYTLGWSDLIAMQPLAGLIPTALRDLAILANTDASETLFRIGDPVRHVYLVIDGEVHLVRSGRHGGEVILQRSREGFVAEASLDSNTYHCDAVAAAPSTLLLFPVVAFRTALDNDTIFRNAWHSHLAKEVRKLRGQCERLSLHSASDRVIHYIASEGCEGVVTLKQPRKSWAAELGLTHEALYRTLRRMQDEGTLLIEGNRVTLTP